MFCCFKTLFYRFSLVISLFIFSYNAQVLATEQTLIILANDIQTCSYFNTQYCDEQSPLATLQHKSYNITHSSLTEIQTHWPNTNTEHRLATLNSLQAIQKAQPQPLSKRELIWAWRDVASFQMSELSEHEFNFVINMLEVSPPQADVTQPLIDTANSKTQHTGLTQTLSFIRANLKVNDPNPTLLLVTAAQSDPYAQIDYYHSVFANAGINVEWLPLTAALVSVIKQQQCDDLAHYRNKTMHLFNRSKVYPAAIAAEYKLCKQGESALVNKIKSSTGVLIVGSESAPTVFSTQGTATPWLTAIAQTPVLITTGKSAQLLQQRNIDISGQNKKYGLGRFKHTLLTDAMSEQNNLSTTFEAMDTKTHNQAFAVNKNSTLVVIDSGDSKVLTVLGERAVEYIHRDSEKQLSYSYWPTKSVIQQHNNRFILTQRSKDTALPPIEVPVLPTQRFKNIFTHSRLQALTQAMCLSQGETALAQQGSSLLSLNKQNNTAYYRLNSSPYGCAIEQLKLTFTP